MKIYWNRVTWYSKLIAVIMALVILGLGFYLGMSYQAYRQTETTLIQSK